MLGPGETHCIVVRYAEILVDPRRRYLRYEQRLTTVSDGNAGNVHLGTLGDGGLSVCRVVRESNKVGFRGIAGIAANINMLRRAIHGVVVRVVFSSIGGNGIV